MKKIGLSIIIMMLFATLAFAGEGQYPKCYNITLTIADTEYSQALAAGAKKMTMQCRTAHAVRFAYETGKVAVPGTPYMTLKSGSSYWEDNTATKMTGQTIYFATDDAGSIIELLVWY